MSRVVLLLGHSAGGIGAHVRELAAALLDQGDDVRVVAPEDTHAAFDLPGPVPWWPAHARTKEGTDLATVAGLVRSAAAVHAHGHQAGVVAAALRVGTHARLAISLHNELRGDPRSPRHRAGSALVRTAVGAADLVTGASDDLVELARRLGARRAASDPVPSPLVPGLLATDREAWRAEHRADLLRRAGLPVDLPVALTVARVAPQKRLEDLCAVAGRVAETPFVHIGSGDATLAGRLRRQGPANLSFLGARADVAEWLLAADVLVLTSEWEARALVVQEAMAAGLPVVATRTGGLPELLEGVGRLPAVGDVAGLADGVAAALAGGCDTSPARDRARSWPTITTRAARWHDWYRGQVDVP